MKPDEIALIKAAQSGDAEAFAKLVTSCQDRVVHVAYGYLHDRDEARDAAQEAFLKAYRALGRFNTRSSFWTWVYRITCNLCKDRLRKRARRPEISLEELGLENEEAPLPSNEPDPRTAASERELERKVRKHIQALPEKQRMVLILRELGGLSYQEIADTAGCKTGTVMSRLFHARRKLAAVLEPFQTTLLDLDETPGNSRETPE